MDVKCRVFENICPDAVIFEIENTNAIFIAPYIAPDNSAYKNYEIFSIINYLIGDLNSRCGTPDINPSKVYIHNPDQVLDLYGRKLLSLYYDNNLTIINGLRYSSRRFDSNFTYFRGSLKSQNDWCIFNSVDNVNSFCILPKINISDHAPCAPTIKCNATVSLGLLEDIALAVDINDTFIHHF